jgi:hypothetical protein
VTKLRVRIQNIKRVSRSLRGSSRAPKRLKVPRRSGTMEASVAWVFGSVLPASRPLGFDSSLVIGVFARVQDLLASFRVGDTWYRVAFRATSWILYSSAYLPPVSPRLQPLISLSTQPGEGASVYPRLAIEGSLVELQRDKRRIHLSSVTSDETRRGSSRTSNPSLGFATPRWPILDTNWSHFSENHQTASGPSYRPLLLTSLCGTDRACRKDDVCRKNIQVEAMKWKLHQMQEPRIPRLRPVLCAECIHRVNSGRPHCGYPFVVSGVG